MSPQDRVAQQFMEHKGLGTAVPTLVEKIEDEYCWYYIYDLPDGQLELEVSWDNEGWHAVVCTFREPTQALA